MFEAAEEVRALGVGINNLPHAVGNWPSSGCCEALDAIAIRDAGIALRQPLGQTIWTEPRGLACRPRGGRNSPSIAAGCRAAVAAPRNAAAAPGALRTGHRLVGFAQDAAGVTARFADPAGEQVAQGDVLVGADGIHSAVRALLHPDDGGIRWQGILMWRGAVDWPAFETGDVMVIAGDLKAKLVCYPIGPGSTPDRAADQLGGLRQASSPASTPPPRREDWSRPGRLDGCAAAWPTGIRLPFLMCQALVRASAGASRIPDVRPRPAALVDHGPRHAAGRCGASDVPGRLERRLAGGAGCALPGGCAGGMRRCRRRWRPMRRTRRPKTAAICTSNRSGGPERVLDVFGQLAPKGFDRIEDVIPPEEIAAIVKGYARLAGFAVGR